MHQEGNRVVETAREAPQRFLDRPIVVVLIVSCALLILFLGFALAEILRNQVSGRKDAVRSADRRRVGRGYRRDIRTHRGQLGLLGLMIF